MAVKQCKANCTGYSFLYESIELNTYKGRQKTIFDRYMEYLVDIYEIQFKQWKTILLEMKQSILAIHMNRINAINSWDKKKPIVE